MLPKVVVDEYGGKRTDPGLLGCGIYFADAASTSAKYSSPSKTRGTRLMVVSEVALGNSKDYYKFDLDLKAPPEGFDSTHGVRKQEGVASDFEVWWNST